VRACVRACARACVCGCVCACVRACARAMLTCQSCRPCAASEPSPASTLPPAPRCCPASRSAQEQAGRARQHTKHVPVGCGRVCQSAKQEGTHEQAPHGALPGGHAPQSSCRVRVVKSEKSWKKFIKKRFSNNATFLEFAFSRGFRFRLLLLSNSQH